MFARREYDLPQRDHAFFPDRLTDDSESLLTDLTVRNDVIGVLQIELIDLVLGDELIDLNDALALYLNCLQFLRQHLDVVAFGNLIPFNDVVVSTSRPVSASTFL